MDVEFNLNQNILEIRKIHRINEMIVTGDMKLYWTKENRFVQLYRLGLRETLGIVVESDQEGIIRFTDRA